MITIFEQDGQIYSAFSHGGPSMAENIAAELELMAGFPGASMKIISIEEFCARPFGRKPRLDAKRRNWRW